MKFPQVEVKTAFIPFEGGLDVVTPPLRMVTGVCTDSQNFVQNINGGYAPYKGYERYDGQTSPSSGAYAVLAATDIGSVSAGDTLTGALSGATGVIIAYTTTYFVLTKVSGTFQAENVTVGAVVKGVSTGAQVTDGATTPQLHAQYRNLAADSYRADIAAVPGSGSILGIVSFSDTQYAFRNNTGGTAVNMYKSSSSGWTQVSLGRELSFTSGGTTEISEGDTITGHTSGATAVITRVALESGTWAGGDAAGRFIFATQTGTFQSENIDVGATPNLATIAGNSSAIAFSTPSGRFEFEIANFGGSANTIRLYGCDGKNRGFEFDGTVLVPIETGMTSDAPEHLCVHKNHLFFSYVGSVQHSSPGYPYVWSPITGAAELAMGDTVTGFMSQPGTTDTAALSIFTRNSISLLYGTGVANWNLVSYKKEAGALAYTIQQIGNTLMLDDRGITSLGSSEKYGNFVDATISKLVQPWLTTRRPNVTASCILRNENQYCLFFSDGSGLYVTIENGRVKGMMPVFFPDPVCCIDSYETTTGEEVVFFGDDSGYVYQMEKGTSFDGDDIEAWITLAFDHFKMPTTIKRYRKATLEVEGTGYYEFSFGYDLDYASTEREQPSDVTETLSLTASNWDEAYWDSFFWDGVDLSPTYLDMTGEGVNVSLTIRSKGDYFNQAVFSGALIEYTPRRRKR